MSRAFADHAFAILALHFDMAYCADAPTAGPDYVDKNGMPVFEMDHDDLVRRLHASRVSMMTNIPGHRTRSQNRDLETRELQTDRSVSSVLALEHRLKGPVPIEPARLELRRQALWNSQQIYVVKMPSPHVQRMFETHGFGSSSWWCRLVIGASRRGATSVSRRQTERVERSFGVGEHAAACCWPVGDVSGIKAIIV